MQNNGRVSNINKTMETQFMSQQEDPTLFNNYSEYSLKGIIEETPLSQIFFSKQNVEGIQKTIRFRVHKEMNKIIDNQSIESIFIIMRSIFLQEGDSGTLSTNIVSSIQNLNQKVINFSIGKIIEQLEQHTTYLSDLTSLPVPLDHAVYENKNNFTYNISNLM
jgi:hypothetical protein